MLCPNFDACCEYIQWLPSSLFWVQKYNFLMWSVAHIFKVKLLTRKSQLPWQAGQPSFMICHNSCSWLLSCVADLIKLSLCGLGGRLLTTALTWQATSHSVSDLFMHCSGLGGSMSTLLSRGLFYFDAVLNFISCLWNLIGTKSRSVLVIKTLRCLWPRINFSNPLGIWNVLQVKLRTDLRFLFMSAQALTELGVPYKKSCGSG